MQINIIFLFFLLNTWSSSLHGQPSSLPKGKKPEMEHFVSVPEKQAPRANCLSMFAKPMGDIGSFDLKDEYFYFLAKKSSTKNNTFEYEVLKYKLGTKDLEVLAKTTLSEVDAILTYGDKPDGVTLMTFNDSAVACKSGAVSHLTLSLHLDHNKPKVIKGSDDAEITESETGQIVFVKTKNSYLEHDLQRSQSRLAAAELRPNERPLFVDRKRRLQYVFKVPNDATDQNFGLIAYKNNRAVAANLKFASGDLLLQQKNLFGVARLDEKANQILVKEIKGWSAVQSSSDYQVQVPVQYKVEDAELKANFTTKKLVVSANSQEMKQRWRSVFLYDYTKGGKPLAVFNPRVGKFVSYVGLSNNGQYAIVATASLKSKKDENIALFDYNTKKWTIIKIP